MRTTLAINTLGRDGDVIRRKVSTFFHERGLEPSVARLGTVLFFTIEAPCLEEYIRLANELGDLLDP